MKERNISLDILRVLIMFMIVAGHVLYHGRILDTVNIWSFEYYVTNLMYAFISVHVNCFVLISGYFLSEKSFSIRKWFTLWGEMFFWSVSLFFVVWLLQGRETVELKDIIKSFLPFTQQRYWFMTTYLLMYILVPFLNAAASNLKKKEYQIALVVWFAVYVLLQNIIFWRSFASFEIRSPMFFAFLYLVGAYIKKYGVTKRFPWILGYIFISCIITLSQVIFDRFEISALMSVDGQSLLYSYNSFTILLSSICFFLVFVNLKVNSRSKFGKFAMVVSPLTLGIYLIHDHPNVREYIWTMLSPYKFSGSKLGVIVVVLVDAVLVFVVACLLEKCRKMAVEMVKKRAMRSGNINGKGYV